MDRAHQLEKFIRNERFNAVVAWLMVLFLAVVVVESLVGGDFVWSVVAFSVIVVALIPTTRYRDPLVMLPWEVLVLAALPVLGRSFGTTVLTTSIATHLSFAAMALIVAVELHVFTRVRMSDSFAVFFVVIATVANVGVWSVVQWGFDIYLGTSFLTTEEALMWNFVAATVAGVVAGVVFALYFRRLRNSVRKSGGAREL
ncbi:MAG: hypothetical protein SXQ77_08995 [Halobacteria archaeon]|nr:hypothetical protein [Halobacteria archaeon]